MSSGFETAFPRTHATLEKARGDVFPDYAAGVSYRDQKSYAASGCDLESLFDLASLTKVLCTTTVCAIAEQKRVISIEQPVRDFFPDFPGTQVRLSHLLDHSSGLPAWLPLHDHFHDARARGMFDARTSPAEARTWYEAEIMKSWTPANFEKQAVYSDLGFLLLGWALEKATGSLLDALFQEWVILPTGLESLQYLPISPNVVPTEDCPWRGRVLRGEVHDDNCYVLGGVAAHAGLFGNVKDVLAMGTLWLEAHQGKANILEPETVRRYWTTTHIPASSRVLGWDGVSPEGSSTGRFFSAAARGHLGFTGTSLWIDPERSLIVTLLTNRVHPVRTNEKIKTFRPIFHDTLLTELGIS